MNFFKFIFRLGSGSSAHSTGVVSIIKQSTPETLFSKYSANLYEKLQNETENLSKFLTKKLFFNLKKI